MKHISAHTQDFLLELGTEELPPKQIKTLVASLKNNIEKNLKDHALTYTALTPFFTARRMAILITALTTKQPDQSLELRGPPLEIAFDKLGQPTAAAIKFANNCNTDITKLDKITTEKGTFLFYKTNKAGKNTIELLPEIIIQSVKKIEIKKPMRWDNNNGPFIMPLRSLLALFGNNTIAVEIFGITATNKSFGHRFHHPSTITITEPQQYEKLLHEQGFVVVDPAKRQQKILEQILAVTQNGKKGTAVVAEGLLAEVTNLVEWPVVLLGSFEQRFLKIPQEVLITTLENQQRCFPLIATTGKLLPHFLIVTNLESKNPQQIIAGNEKVIRARFSDAEYFYNHDLQHNFADNREKLKSIIFQDKLGTIYDKTLRLKNITAFIAAKINADVDCAERAAELAKCDLVTSMVGEFPELQGVMGYYYATINEKENVALAIKEQYLPRFSHDKIPTSPLGCALAIADRIDTMVGLFSINKIPSGEKDPFGLRRAAAGIVHIILEKKLPLDLKELLTTTCIAYQDRLKDSGEIKTKVLDFIYERLRSLYLEDGKNTNIFRAVLAVMPTDLLDFAQRFAAVDKFTQLSEANDLIEVYKRIRNILEKSLLPKNTAFDFGLATEQAEHVAAKTMMQHTKIITDHYQQKKYFETLAELVKLKQPLNNFFDKVMVFVEEEKIRNNRLALLKHLQDLFMTVADLSYLVSGNKTFTL